MIFFIKVASQFPWILLHMKSKVRQIWSYLIQYVQSLQKTYRNNCQKLLWKILLYKESVTCILKKVCLFFLQSGTDPQFECRNILFGFFNDVDVYLRSCLLYLHFTTHLLVTRQIQSCCALQQNSFLKRWIFLFNFYKKNKQIYPVICHIFQNHLTGFTSKVSILL